MTIFNISPKAEEVTNNVFMVNVPIGETVNLFELCKGIGFKDKYHIDPCVSLQGIDLKLCRGAQVEILNVSTESVATNTFTLKNIGVYHCFTLNYRSRARHDSSTGIAEMLDMGIDGELNLITGDVILNKYNCKLKDEVEIVGCKLRVELTPK